MKLPFKPHLLVLLCSTGLFAASGVMFVKSRASEPVAPAPVAQQQVATPAAQPAPVVAPAYTAAQIDQWVAPIALYPDALPERGDIQVEFRNAQENGVTGVIAAVVGLITGAAGIGGFKGIAGRFSRRDPLLFDDPDQPGEIAFMRRDSGKRFELTLHLEQVPDRKSVV